MSTKRTRKEIAQEQAKLIKGVVGLNDNAIREFYRKVSICNPDYHHEVQRAYRAKLEAKLKQAFPLTINLLPKENEVVKDLAHLKRTRWSREKMVTYLFHFLYEHISSLTFAAARRDLLRLEWATAMIKYSVLSEKISAAPIKLKNGVSIVSGIAILGQETHLDLDYPAIELKRRRALAEPKTIFVYQQPLKHAIEIFEPDGSESEHKVTLQKLLTVLCAKSVTTG